MFGSPRQTLKTAAALFGAAAVTGALSLSAAISPASAQTPPSTVTAPAPAGPGHLVIAIDTAKAINTQRFNESKVAAETVIKSLPGAQVAIVSYGGAGAVVYQLGSSAGAITALQNLNQAANDLDGQAAQSQMTQGLSLSVDTLTTVSDPRAILVVTDGTNKESKVNLQTARQRALSNSINIAVIDTRFPGDNEATKKALIDEIRGVTGIVVSLNEPKRLDEISKTILVQVAPKTLAFKDTSSLSTKLFSSSLILVIGGLLIGGAIFFTAFQFMGPKEIKVNLTGIPERKAVKDVKNVKTPMAGLANKLTDLADKKLEDSGRSKGIQSWLERAAINLRSGEFIVVVLVATFAGSALLWKTQSATKGLIGLFLIPFAARKFVNFKANKRTRRFGDQLSDTLQLISSSMRAGQGFMQALDAVARESESPTSEEFQRVVVEARLGRDLVDSMKALAQRIQCEDLEWVIPAVEINREVGGDLAEVLEQVGATIRDRADLKRQVKTLSAEGRLSAIVLIALPICIGLFIKTSNPEYMQPLFAGIGLYFLGAGSLLMLIGSIWLFNICKIEF
jgi:tight adherence protein B